MKTREKMVRKIICWCLCFAMLFTSAYVESTFAANATKKTSATDKKSKKKKKPLYKEGSIYLDEALGFDKYNALKTVNDYFNANWNKGLHYNGAIYHGLNSYKVGTNINYNFETNTQYKYRDAKGYGYNCTGVVTSVMYYASGTKKSIPDFYEDLINGKGLGRICNGFAWWDYFNRHNVKKYCAGRVSNNADVDRVLNKARDLKTGYVIYFSPTVRGGDCHLGFYWGTNSKGNHMMRHCIWRGFEWSKAFPGARGTYDLYLIPLSKKKNGVIEKTFNLQITRKAKVKKVQSAKKSKKKSGKKKKAKKTYYSLKGDTYNFYGARDKKGLHKKLVYKEKYTVTKKVVKKVKVKTKSKKTGKTKVKYKKKTKTVTKNKVRTILPLTLNKNGEAIRNIEVKVKLVYKKGKLKNYYISSIDGKELSPNRKNKKSFWIKEKKGSNPKQYKYNDVVYCIKAIKIENKKKAKKNLKKSKNKRIPKINLCLYKGSINDKNLVKKAKEGKTLKIKVK